MLIPRTERNSAPKASSAPLVRVVDGDPASHDLCRELASVGGFAVSQHATAGDLLQRLDDSTPGCLIVDLVLPDSAGIDLLQQLNQRRCRLPIVFTGGAARIADAVRAMKLGGVDFLEKPCDRQEMLAAIRRAIDIDAGNRRSILDQEQLERRFHGLTPRETQVLEQVVRGAANKEVANKLGLSPKTVEVHRANVMRKTQAKSLAELVRMHVAVRS